MCQKDTTSGGKQGIQDGHDKIEVFPNSYGSSAKLRLHHYTIYGITVQTKCIEA